MSFEDIRIYRDLPIINDFVQIPPNEPRDKTRVTTSEALSGIASSTVERLSMGSGRCRGSKTGQQQWIRLPGLAPNEWYDSDPIADL